jgi:hypothetical protein
MGDEVEDLSNYFIGKIVNHFDNYEVEMTQLDQLKKD